MQKLMKPGGTAAATDDEEITAAVGGNEDAAGGENSGGMGGIDPTLDTEVAQPETKLANSTTTASLASTRPMSRTPTTQVQG